MNKVLHALFHLNERTSIKGLTWILTVNHGSLFQLACHQLMHPWFLYLSSWVLECNTWAFKDSIKARTPKHTIPHTEKHTYSLEPFFKMPEVLLLRSAVNDYHPHCNRNLSTLQDVIINLWKVAANLWRPSGSSQIAIRSTKCDWTLSFLKSMQTHMLQHQRLIHWIIIRKKNQSVSSSFISSLCTNNFWLVQNILLRKKNLKKLEDN